MNRVLFIFLIILFASCQKKDLIVYEEGSGIYFDNKEMGLDTVAVPWGLKNTDVTTQTVRFEVKLFGNITQHDRAFRIKVKDDIPDSVRALPDLDYKPFPLEYKIPAGAASTFIEIELLRSEELKEGNRILAIELVESDELKFLYSRRINVPDVGERMLDVQRVLKMNENFPIPRWWSLMGTGYFGTWSMKKAILICDMMGIDREKWIGNVLNDEDFNESILRFAGVFIHRWLQEQDPPVLDEDGTPMEMGPRSKR